MNYKENSFDVIRLVASILIMFSHYSVAVFGLENLAYSRFLFAGASLVAFFVICGFFLIPSLERSSGGVYLLKRVFRIYPVYIVSVVAMIIAAYVLSVIQGGVQLSVEDVLIFAVKMILKPNGYEINGISNGAIWAIWIELQIYVLAVLCKKVLLSNCSKTFWGIIFACAFLINLIGNELVSFCQNNGFGFVAKIYSSSFLPYLYFFLIGVIGYKFKDSVIRFVCNNLIYVTVAFLAWHLLIKYHVEPLAEAGYYTDPITVLLAGMMTLGLAFRFGKFRLKTELSYGIYVWHMPVITFLIQVVSEEKWLLILISMGLTIMLAVLSHIFIEKKVTKIENHIL